MPRPLSDLDPTDGPIAAFSHELRGVRADAGEPTLDVMARRGNVSKSALSEAMSGKKVPSQQVLVGFLTGCQIDEATIAQWLARRQELVRTLDEQRADATPQEVADADTGAAPDAPSSHRPYVLRRKAILVGGIAASLALLAGTGLGFAAARATASAPTAADSPPLQIATGDNPVTDGCVEDGKVGASATQPDGTLLEIMWSTKCSANWGRITRYDGLTAGNSLTVTLTGHFHDAPNPQIATAMDQQSIYTPIMLVGPTDKACVTGSRTVAGETIVAEEPACG